MKDLIESTKKFLAPPAEAPTPTIVERTTGGEFDSAKFSEMDAVQLEDFLIEFAVWMKMEGMGIKDESGDDAMLKAAKHISEAGKSWKKRSGN